MGSRTAGDLFRIRLATSVIRSHPTKVVVRSVVQASHCCSDVGALIAFRFVPPEGLKASIEVCGTSCIQSDNTAFKERIGQCHAILTCRNTVNLPDIQQSFMSHFAPSTREEQCSNRAESHRSFSGLLGGFGSAVRRHFNYYRSRADSQAPMRFGNQYARTISLAWPGVARRTDKTFLSV
jgi:hypothetical protein